MPYPGARRHGMVEQVGPWAVITSGGTMSTRTAAASCTAVRREDVAPVCPYCETELREVHMQRVRGQFGVGRAFIFFCPKCRKVLGTGTQWYPLPG